MIKFSVGLLHPNVVLHYKRARALIFLEMVLKRDLFSNVSLGTFKHFVRRVRCPWPYFSLGCKVTWHLLAVALNGQPGCVVGTLGPITP